LAHLERLRPRGRRGRPPAAGAFADPEDPSDPPAEADAPRLPAPVDPHREELRPPDVPLRQSQEGVGTSARARRCVGDAGGARAVAAATCARRGLHGGTGEVGMSATAYAAGSRAVRRTGRIAAPVGAAGALMLLGVLLRAPV